MRVYSHSYWLVIAAERWRGRGGKLSRNLGKKTRYWKCEQIFSKLLHNTSLSYFSIENVPFALKVIEERERESAGEVSELGLYNPA